MANLSRDQTPTVAHRISKSELDHLIALLRSQGYTVVGPKFEDCAIVYAEINALEELPLGYRDAQQPGKYRVTQTGHKNYFEFNVGPHSRRSQDTGR